MEPEGVRHEAVAAATTVATTTTAAAAGKGRKPAARRRVSLDFLPSSGGSGDRASISARSPAIVVTGTAQSRPRGSCNDSGSEGFAAFVDCPGFPQTGYTSQLSRPLVVTATGDSPALPPPLQQYPRRRNSLTHAPTSSASVSSHVPGHRPPHPILARTMATRRIQSFDEYSTGGSLVAGGGASRAVHATPPTTGRRRLHRRASADLLTSSSFQAQQALGDASPSAPGTAMTHRGPRQGSRSLTQRRNSASIRSMNEAAAAAAASAETNDNNNALSPTFVASFHEDTTTATPTSFLDYEFDDNPFSSHSGTDIVTTSTSGGHIMTTAADFPSPWEDDPFLTESPMHQAKPRLGQQLPHQRQPNQHNVAAVGAVAAAAATTLNTRGSSGGGGGGSGIMPDASLLAPASVSRGTVQGGRTTKVAHRRRFSEGPAGAGSGSAAPNCFPSPDPEPSPTSSSSSSPSPSGTAARMNRFRRANSMQPGARVERNSRRSLSRGRSSSSSGVSVGRYSGSSASRSPSPATYRRMLERKQLQQPEQPAPSQQDETFSPRTKPPHTPQARGSSSRSLQLECGASPSLRSLTRTPSQRGTRRTNSGSLGTSPRNAASPPTTASSRPARANGNSSKSSDESSGGDSIPVAKSSRSKKGGSASVDDGFGAPTPWGDATPFGVASPSGVGDTAGAASGDSTGSSSSAGAVPKKPSKRSGRRGSTSSSSLNNTAAAAAAAAASRIAKPSSIPYPATPSTVASSESFSTRQSAVSPAAVSSSPCSAQVQPASLTTWHKMHRRASTSNATCDSQSVRSSLSRIHQKQQRRMSSTVVTGSGVQW